MITQSTGYGNCGDKIFFNNEANAYSTMDRRHNFRVIDMFYNESTGVLTLTQNPDVQKHAYIGDNPVGSNQARSHKDAVEYILDFNKFQKWGFDRFDKDKHYVIANKYADSKKKYAYLSFSNNANRWYETFLKDGDEFYDKDTDIKYRLIDGKLKNVTDVGLDSKQEMHDGYGHEIHLIVNPRTNSTVTLNEANNQYAGLMPATHFTKVDNLEKDYAASLKIEDYKANMRQRKLSLINKNGEAISSIYVDANQWLDSVILDQEGNNRIIKFNISGPNGPENTISVNLESVLDIKTEDTNSIHLNYSEENVLSADVKLQDNVENKLNITLDGLGAYIKWKDKGYVNFDYGTKSGYNQLTHQDYIYFSTDTNQIFLNGIPFGLDLKSLDLQLVKKVDLGEVPGTILVTNSNGIEYTISLPLATQESNGLLSAKDKLKLDSTPNLIVTEIHEKIDGTNYGLEIITNNTVTGQVENNYLILDRATQDHDGLLSAIDKKKIDSMGQVVTELSEMEAENEQFPTRIRYTVADKDDTDTPDIIRYMNMINATSTSAGLQSKEDKLKEDRIIDYVTERSEYAHEENGLSNEFTHYNPSNNTIRTTKLIIPNATQDEHGLQSAADKKKEDNIIEYVNNMSWLQEDSKIKLRYLLYNPNRASSRGIILPIPEVTHENNGSMSYSDKIYLDSLPSVLDELKTNLETVINNHIQDKNNPHETTAEQVGFAEGILEANFMSDLKIGTRTGNSLNLVTEFTNFNDAQTISYNVQLRSATTSYAGLMSAEHRNAMEALKTDTSTTNYLTAQGTPSPTWQLNMYDNGNIIKSSNNKFELLDSTSTNYVGLVLQDITIKGNVTQLGESFITNAETVEVTDNTILLNKGETGQGVTKGVAGLEVDRGTLPKFNIIFDETDDRFKCGSEGDLRPIMLRDDESNLINDGVFVWDATNKIAKTVDIQSKIDGYIPLSGTQTGKPITGALEFESYFIDPNYQNSLVIGKTYPSTTLPSYYGIQIREFSNSKAVFLGFQKEVDFGTTYHSIDYGVQVYDNQIQLNHDNIYISTNGETLIGNSNKLYTSGLGSNEKYKIWNENNDGSGSGLDADLLDGKHASEFASSTDLNNCVLKSGDTMTGALKLSAYNANLLTINDESLANNASLTFSHNNSISGTVGFRADVGTYIQNNIDNIMLSITGDRPLLFDGAGLDLLKRIAFVEDLETGYLPLSGGTLTNTLHISGDSYTLLTLNSSSATSGINLVFSRNGVDKCDIGYEDSILGAYLADQVSDKVFCLKNGPEIRTNSGTLIGEIPYKSDLDAYLPLSGGTLTGVLKIYEIQNTSGQALLTDKGAEGVTAGSQYGIGTYTLQGVIRSNNLSLIHYRPDGAVTIWDAANDGSGSGLDADLLDGLHASSFALKTELPSLANVAYINQAQTWTAYQDFTAGAGNSGSDMRFKDNISIIPNVLNKINNLNIIQYTWSKEGERQIDTFGVSADELLKDELLSKIVHERPDEEKTKFVEYDRFGVLAIKAIQELTQEINSLKQRIKDLEDKLN